MNAKKLALIVAIFAAASAAWNLLGRTVTDRTNSSRRSLGAEVARMYGPKDLVQAAPIIVDSPGAAVTRGRAPDASRVEVNFQHESRYRGLIWFSTYQMNFEAVYTIQPPGGEAGAPTAVDPASEIAPAGGPARPAKAWFQMALPADAGIDAPTVKVGGQPAAVDGRRIEIELDLGGGPVEVAVSYRTMGQDSWQYDPQSGGNGLRQFRLAATTDFADIDYPSSGMSPTEAARPVTASNGRSGRLAVWNYDRMLPAENRTIGVVMPRMQAGGELSARISRFAPVSLFFFLTVMITIQLIRGLKLHPMNYLLIAAGFFAFHILLAYLVDHLPVLPSFWIASAVSVFVVVTYLWLVLGARAGILFAGAAQLVYLVFFSYAFFWEGWTGLTVVIGAIVTLFLIMLLTARVDWDAKFPDLARRRRAEEGQWVHVPPPPSQPPPVARPAGGG